MSLTLVLLVAFSIVLDVIGQLCFKLGLDRLPELEGGFRLQAFWGQVFNAPLLWAGIGAYVVEFFVWLEALSRAPLSLLFPAAALAYCGVVLVGKVVLGETVSRRRWAGTLVITLGVMLVAIAGSQV
ncbi:MULTISPECIES: transporter [Pseudomonas]|uniref:transporter n=1 Tax=Pseudomonas TaxID=286 RepID=UPI000CFAA2B1|nr:MULTISPECIES: transporter [Pseudomonas]PQZ95398.1 transporter [Pseudomonas trivialis]PRB30484.1 transporter [Pseudomonas sp. MYb60]